MRFITDKISIFSQKSARPVYAEISNYDLLLACLLFFVSLSFNITGLTWALPSETRREFYPQRLEWYEVPKSEGRLYQISPYEPYHPDESFLLDALSNMDPANLDFNPHFFNYPTLSIYITGAVLKIGELCGYLNIVNSKEFYITHPEQMARIYLLGRLLAALMSALTVVFIYLTAKLLFEWQTGLFSAFTLASMPLWVRNSHFMLVNVPSAMWMSGAALLAVIAFKRVSQPLLLLSAFFAGLAASTKYPSGLIILLPLFVWWHISYTNRDKRITAGITQESHRKVVSPGTWYLGFALVGVSIIGFIGGTPYLLISPDEFLQGLLFEGGTKLGLPSFINLLSLLIVSSGTVLCLLIMIGLSIAIAKWRMWPYQFVLLWVMASMVQRLISSTDLARYFVPALPALAICAGIAINTIRQYITELKIAHSTLIGWAVGLLLLIPTVGYSIDILQVMQNGDIRTQAASWLTQHLDTNQIIGIYDKITYDLLPINAEKYDLQIMNELEEEDSLPPVVIFTSETVKYWPIDIPTSYTSQTFTQRPSSIWTWPVKEWPHDWAYTFLDIHILFK